jgi:biopolymer transport protein ExbD
VALVATQAAGKQSTDLRIFAGPGGGQQGAGYLRRSPRSALISVPPPFALIAAFALLPVVVPLSTTFFGSSLQGIRVLTSGRSRLTPRYDQWTKPLLLRIDAQKHWVFDGKPVSAEEFPAALRQALSRRPDWFVCLDADRGLDFGAPVRAMDIIQGLSAKIIIATPKAVDDGCVSIFGR